MGCSPASEAVVWLRLTVGGRHHALFGDPGPSARFALRHADVALLAEVLAGPWTGYVPDLLTPQPPAGRGPRVLGCQLEAVRATTAEVVARQLLFGPYPGGRMPDDVRRAMESDTFARRAANALRLFWNTTLADRWPALEAAMTADITERGLSVAAHGLGRMLGSLHTEMRWTGTELQIDKRYDETTDLVDRDLVLAPSLLGPPTLRVQVCDPGDAVITYPVGGRTTDRSRRGRALGDLVGTSRAAILEDLDVARTTTQLAQRHGLAISTVSHHLGVLLGAGLVIRTRTGLSVEYRRTDRGDEMLDAVRA